MNTYNGSIYPDPREELKARATKAVELGEPYIAIPVELIFNVLSMKECEARTVVNGDRSKGILIEVKCTRPVDPVTGRHTGLHVNGKTNWA